MHTQECATLGHEFGPNGERVTVERKIPTFGGLSELCPNSPVSLSRQKRDRGVAGLIHLILGGLVRLTARGILSIGVDPAPVGSEGLQLSEGNETLY